MKSRIFIIFLLISSNSFAQKIYSTTYLKFNNKEVPNKDSADFVRSIYTPENNEKYYSLVEKFKNGLLKKEGKIAPDNIPLIFFEGLVNQYNLNGSLYSSESYKQGQLNGDATYYFENVKISAEGTYHFSRGKAYFETKKLFSKDGKNFLDEEGNGFVEINYNGIQTKGRYKGGYKEGKWDSYNRYTIDKIEETFYKGAFKTGKITNINGDEITYKDVYTYPYCDGATITKSSGDGKRMPLFFLTKTNDKEGLTAYSFDIDRFGNAKNFKLLLSVSDYSDKTALNILSKKKWHPASNRGRTYDYYGFVAGVKFSLD